MEIHAMAFLLRLLFALSTLAILAGVLIKTNHWNYNGVVFINSGIAGLAIYVIGNFTMGEIKKKKNP